MLITKIASLED